MIALVATTVALVATAVPLAYGLWPSLSPDPHTVFAAHMKVRTVGPGASYREFLERVGDKPRRLSPRLLRSRGYIVYLQIRVEGGKHGTLRLDQIQYSAKSGRRIPGQARPEDSLTYANTPNEQWIHPVFVLESPYAYPIFTRLELFDKDTLLAYADTPVLRPRQIPPS